MKLNENEPQAKRKLKRKRKRKRKEKTETDQLIQKQTKHDIEEILKTAGIIP